jgi:hypothetical protein
MGLGNDTENDFLKVALQGTDPSWRAGATQYLALFKDNAGTAASLETQSLTYEADYTGYTRVAITKATAWTDGGSTFSNAVQMQSPLCTAVTPNSLKYFAIVDTASGPVNMMISGTFNSTLNVDNGIQPTFPIGYLEFSAD